MNVAVHRASDLLGWLASLPPAARDAAVEERLGIRELPSCESPPGDHLIGYHPSGIASIVRALVEARVTPDDVFIDLGSGLGKVVLLARLLTGARARGVELQAPLADRARACAERLGIEAHFSAGDARDAPIEDGTVFYLYVPFTGPALAGVVERLRAVASRRDIVVCALGVDLSAPWLVPRPVDSFWLSLYDTNIHGALPRAHREPLAWGTAADVIARDLPASPQIP